jgi:CHAT domain-containing protein/predicted negative regulator of RcsB-dependent stress response
LGCRSPEKIYRSIKEETDREEFDSALAHVNAALAEHQGRSDEWIWRLRILKARILVSRNQHTETITLLAGDLPAVLALTDIAEQRELYRGIAHRNGQQFAEAEKDFDQAERIGHALPPSFKYQIMIAKADLEVDEKKYADAEANYKRALVLARQEKLPPLFEMSALGNLGRLATSQEHFDEAVDINQLALRLSRELKLQGHMATIRGNLGWAYFELGDFENALEFYKQGADGSQQSGLATNTAYWFSGVANSYVALREYAPAEELARTTLKRAHELRNAQAVTACLNTLTDIMLRKGRLAEAEQYNSEALKMEDKFGMLDALLFAGHIAIASKHFNDAEKLFYQVLAEPKAETLVRWQAEAGLAYVWDAQGRFVEAERQYLKAINTIEQARRSVNHDELRLSFLSSGIEVYGGYIDFLIRHGRAADALNQAELSRARTLAEGLSVHEPVASSHAAQHIPPQEIARRFHATLLFYWLDEKHSYLWAVTPSRTTYFTLPPASEIDPLIKSYRDLTLKSGDLLKSAKSTGEKLYASLLAPAEKLVPPGSRVILLPDASLYGLNFETLIVPGPQPHFWIEDVTATTAGSLSLLVSAVNRVPPKKKNLLLVGDPLPVPEFGPLPQAPAEMQKIEQYFPESRRAILQGPRATPSAYLGSEPGRFDYLHFVTHGTASSARPLESAVILSKESSSDTYKLYARDIVQHRLNANLVTISACNGSGTRAYSGEGLVGLSWAFLRAGAHNVIGALWEVSDASTPELMDAFYRELFQGKDTATALRDAKLGLLHSAIPDSVFKKPFYWAPFQLYAGS